MTQTPATISNAASTSPTSGLGAPGRAATNHSPPHNRSLCLNDIWRLAHQKWETAGRPEGDSSRFWLEAEQELLQVT
jgi:hypothetical protein